MKIDRILAQEIYDSAGWPTLQCQVILENGDSVMSSVPSGTSVGEYEALELRDGDSRLCGKGVRKAIDSIEQHIAPYLVGQPPQAYEADMKMLELDGTARKAKLGANAMLAVSMALYRAEALCEGMELYEFIATLLGEESVTLPFPLLNVINGGAHTDNNLRIQEFLIMPVGAPTFRSAFEAGVLVFHELGTILKSLEKSTALGMEGGYACHFRTEREALDLLLEAIERVNSKHTLSCVIALDIAASQFYDPETKLYTWHDRKLTTDEMVYFYQDLVTQYPIYSLEDPLSQDDWPGWIMLTQALKEKVQIVGDDLFATEIDRIARGAELHAATSVIIKPNQVGTITETLQSVLACKELGLHTVVSHRSAETEDTFIADLAVGSSSGQIKAGSCARSERVAKYNRLLTIEDELTFSLFDV